MSSPVVTQLYPEITSIYGVTVPRQTGSRGSCLNNTIIFYFIYLFFISFIYLSFFCDKIHHFKRERESVWSVVIVVRQSSTSMVVQRRWIFAPIRTNCDLGKMCITRFFMNLVERVWYFFYYLTHICAHTRVCVNTHKKRTHTYLHIYQ